MEKKSLWAIVEDDPNYRSPNEILLEQADFLAEKTGRQLKGDVQYLKCGLQYSFNEPCSIQIHKEGLLNASVLGIRAPKINDYYYKVLTIAYDPIELYPTYFENSSAHEPLAVCDNEQELMNELEKVLSSEKIQRVLNHLYNQSKKLKIDEDPF